MNFLSPTLRSKIDHCHFNVGSNLDLNCLTIAESVPERFFLENFILIRQQIETTKA